MSIQEQIKKSNISIIFNILIIIFLCCTAVYSSRLFLICCFFLLPTIIAIINDNNNDKCLALTIGLCNVSGILTYAPEMLSCVLKKVENSWINSLPKIHDVLLVYSFSLLGVGLYMFLPQIIILMQKAMINSQKDRLKDKINFYKAKWDL